MISANPKLHLFLQPRANKILFLIIFFIVQWLSQDFKGDLDIDYIWVFISFYVNMGIGGPKMPDLRECWANFFMMR